MIINWREKKGAGNGQSINLTIKPDCIKVYPINIVPEEWQDTAIVTFPIPVVGQLNIQFKKPACSAIGKYWNNGSISFERDFRCAALIHINHLELPTGIYMVKVSTMDGVHYEMIVISEWVKSSPSNSSGSGKEIRAP